MRPVYDNPSFFVAAVLLGCFASIGFSAIEHVKMIRFTVCSLAESFVAAYVFAILVTLIRSRIAARAVKTLILAGLAVWGIVELGTIAMTGTPVTPESATLMAETNSGEAAGFFNQYFSIRVAAILMAALAISLLTVIVARKGLRLASRSNRVSAVAAVITVVAVATGVWCNGRMLGVTTINDYQSLLVWESQGPADPDKARTYELRYAAPTAKIPYLIKCLQLQNANIDKWTETQQRALATGVSATADADFNIIVIIGESFIRRHSQLYGYPLPTNPVLTQESEDGRLITFSDMMSTANFTSPSLRSMFGMNDSSAGEEWYEGVYFPLLLKQAGWSVYHYDNQTVNPDEDMGIGRFFYSPFNMANVYDGVADSLLTYDGDYVKHINAALAPKENPGKKLVIYHLMGQHFPASARFPGAGKFTADDIVSDKPWMNPERRQEVADYDNATLYNDSVVGAIIDRWRDSPSVAIYLSDHGEDIWDLAPMEARNKQMPDDPEWIDRQYHIPFFVWMSDSFRELYPEISERIAGAKNRSGSLDNLGQMIVGICGISTPYYKPERDMTSPRFVPVKRVSVDGNPLD